MDYDGCIKTPDSKVDGANMGPTWGRQDPGGPMLAPSTLVISPAKFNSPITTVGKTFRH